MKKLSRPPADVGDAVTVMQLVRSPNAAAVQAASVRMVEKALECKDPVTALLEEWSVMDAAALMASASPKAVTYNSPVTHELRIQAARMWRVFETAWRRHHSPELKERLYQG